ncbi:MAG TPA: helix-turn-helix domain-containing protein [Candidatus Dojkabacteria bacterium]|nr:helix-turn-helix domain-containing protein [Candidatus Dojkabacteria bacterium]HQF36795.1 helix-turn-helix domain-containing protein [Candidatus Dojkabacteria bacterium]
MSLGINELSKLLKPFGLGKDESSVYIELLSTGMMSALQLSRKLQIGRTKVYRILEDLEKWGLVNTVARDYGKRFEASSVENLELLVDIKRKEFEKAKRLLPDTVKALSIFANQDITKSKVLYYVGEMGLKQVIWNLRHARGSICSFISETMDEFYASGIGDDVRLELLKNKVKIHELCCTKRIAPWTNIAEIVKNYWEARYISSEEIKFEFEFMIYNNVLTIYGIDKGELFCVEIYNEKCATTMRKLFEFVMKYAKPYKVINDHGEAVVEE